MGSKKAKGLYIEKDAFTLRIAEVNSLSAPLRVDALHECSLSDVKSVRTAAGLEASRNRFLPVHYGCLPDSRFFELIKVPSLAKARDGAFWETTLKQLRLEPELVQHAIMDAGNGINLEQLESSSGSADLLLFGALRKEMLRYQGEVVGENIVPESLQISTVSAIGGMRDFLIRAGVEAPVLFLEMGENVAHLFVLARGRLVLTRSVAFGYNSVLPLICSELGFKDQESAKKLFFSNTFDFRDIGGVLFGRLLKELNAASGFYEMQTGQPLYGFAMTGVPGGLDWVGSTIAKGLEIDQLELDWEGWLTVHGVSLGDDVAATELTVAHLPLMSLMMDLSGVKDED